MVEHGLSDDPVNVATYRDGDTIPRSSHLEEAARVRYPSKVSQMIEVRMHLGWQQSVSRASVGELAERLKKGFDAGWEPSELWLIGSYGGFADDTYDPDPLVKGNANLWRGEDPPPSLELEGIEVVQPEDPVDRPIQPPSRKKQGAVKKATAAKAKASSSSASASKTTSGKTTTTTSKRAAKPTSASTSTSTVPAPKETREEGGPSTASKSSGMPTSGTPSGAKGASHAPLAAFDLTRSSDDDEPALVVVETTSAPTSLVVTPVATQQSVPMDVSARQSPAASEISATGRETPLLPPPSTQTGVQASGPAAEGSTTTIQPTAAAQPNVALGEHDYALAEGQVRRDSESAEEEAPPEEEPSAAVARAAAEIVAERARGSSGEYVDASTGSQPVAPRADASTERPP